MLLKSSGINFNNLSAEGYTAFVLSILFTIITLAAFIYFARHKEVNGLLAAVIEYILPSVTVFCWMYLIFIVTDFTVSKSLLYAFITAIAFLAVAVAVGLIVAGLKNSKAKDEAHEVANEEEKKDDVLVLEAPAEEKVEEVVVEQAKEEAAEESEEPAPETEEVAEETTEETTE
ncbi:MAG: hypothetical protein IJ817_00740, partial [Clostridia bacterium]|nr:hypothetical protein [Clostridia bacterium]